jgi:hypothetical protein
MAERAFFLRAAVSGIGADWMFTKELCVQKYEDCKASKNGGIPEFKEFLKYAGIVERRFVQLWGSSAYSKLQTAAGDVPSKLQTERTPIATIMQQYGGLVAELGKVPPYAEWDHRGLKPTASGLRNKPHNMKWSELPEKFVEWVTNNKVAGYEGAIEILTASVGKTPKKLGTGDTEFFRLIKDVRAWTPARRRNSEGEYKIELRKHLEALNYELNEEFGESKYDLLVRREYAIEIKKDPDLSEYDRLFGQLGRHLQHQCKVIVLIVDATRKDKYDNFALLVDKYLNVNENSVEIIKL